MKYQTHQVKVENLKRIMNWENILPVLLYISTNDITELNKLIHARAKLVCKKI